jgi:hypothetical protein
MEENNNQNGEVELVKGEEVKQAVKKRANQTLRMGLIWFLAGLLITAISWIMSFFNNGDGSYTLMWGLSLYGIFILFKGFDLSQKADQLSKDGIPKEELDSLLVSKTKKVLTKVFVAIGVIGIVISGIIALMIYGTIPEVNEDYGTVIMDNTSTTGWVTYYSEKDNIQIDFPSKPVSFEINGYYEMDEITDIRFFTGEYDLEGHNYNLFIESVFDTNTSERIITNLRDQLSNYEENIFGEIEIITESDNEIIYQYIDSDDTLFREKLIYAKDYVYGLSYNAKPNLFTEEKWNYFVDSFLLKENIQEIEESL